MNTLLWSFELNIILTVICKAFKMKDSLVLLAFYRAILFLRLGIRATDSDKEAHERAIEEL
jgi:hypothetical protein